MNDKQRKGDTVKPFSDKQSWDLLMKLLGPDWQDLDQKGYIKKEEEVAAKGLLKELGGVSNQVIQWSLSTTNIMVQIVGIGNPASCKADQKSQHWWCNNCLNIRFIQRPSKVASPTAIR